MKSAVYVQFGTPEKVLTVTDRPTPQPGRGEVLVQMALSPVHNHDLMTIAGQYGFKPSLPAVPGTEAVGVVAALGEGVNHLKVGQRIAGGAEGTWAEYYLANAARVVPVPEGVSDETACQLVSMPLSARMLLETLDVKAGDWIIQNAANGAVGKLVAKYGAEQGINVVGLVRRADAVDALKAQGNDRVVATDGANWRDEVKAVTGGAPILRALDSLAGDGPAQLISVVADGAELVSFGAMTQRPLRIAAGDLLFRRITIKGFWGARPPLPAERIGALLGELVADAAAGKLTMEIEAAYPLDDVARAAQASDEPGRKGKVAIRGR